MAGRVGNGTKRPSTATAISHPRTQPLQAPETCEYTCLHSTPRLTAGLFSSIHLSDGSSRQVLRYEKRGRRLWIEGGSRTAVCHYRVRGISVMRVQAPLPWLPWSCDRVLVSVFKGYLCEERLSLMSRSLAWYCAAAEPNMMNHTLPQTCRSFFWSSLPFSTPEPSWQSQATGHPRHLF